MKKAFIVTAALMVASTSWAADSKMVRFFSSVPGDAEAEAIVYTAGSTLLWASIHAEDEHNKPLFCPPENLAITGGQYAQIGKDFLMRNPLLQDADMDTFPNILLKALVDTFPCR